MIKKVLLFLLLSSVWVTFSVKAAPEIVSIDVKHGECYNDAEITVNVINTTGEVKYGLLSPSPITVDQQSSNIFTGLPAGTYVVAVYDASTGSVPVTATAEVTTSYINFVLQVPTTGTSATNRYCEETGTLTVTATGGVAPYRCLIRNILTNETEEKINTTGLPAATKTFNFTGLPTGQYEVEVEDGCGQMRITVPGSYISVTSLGTALKDIEFNSFDFTPYSIAGNGSCDRIYVRGSSSYSYNINGTGTGSSGIGGLYYLNIQYRVEYPAGSGIYTA